MFGHTIIKKDAYEELEKKNKNLEHSIKQILAKQAEDSKMEIGYRFNEDGTITLKTKKSKPRRNAQNGRFVGARGVLFEIN